jgi:hypothetical protein
MDMADMTHLFYALVRIRIQGWIIELLGLLPIFAGQNEDMPKLIHAKARVRNLSIHLV